ncbi:putative RNA-directed DNA polymerase from transposon BS [Anabarilius grahami]|uniref:Putative RNA-directed DNA polymerase from transposon BS n=2 Tax=cellular organisms TaxID=131567 RepID=A0A3N0XHA5_ANAGA|nr:putative RNA-directed DNA polymerase from transposon BS [Anabarilius grahami]
MISHIHAKKHTDVKNVKHYSLVSFAFAVSSQLCSFLERNSICEDFQSGFRPYHSTETALIRVTNDLLLSSDRGCISLLVLLDLSAAFDTIDHNILLNRLENYVGISGIALSWFKSYLSDRYQFVVVNEERSYQSQVQYGVPQGSVLGPLLFTLYMLPLGDIIRKHGVSFHRYADDTQLYISSRPDETYQFAKLTECITDIKNWMTSNFLQLNSEKTEILIFGPKTSSRNNLEYCLTLDGCSVYRSQPDLGRTQMRPRTGALTRPQRSPEVSAEIESARSSIVKASSTRQPVPQFLNKPFISA